MEQFLTKLLSKQFADELSAFILEQVYSSDPKEVKQQKAVTYGVNLLEKLDDGVELIPVFGPFMKVLVDNPIADGAEVVAVTWLVNTLYRGVKVQAAEAARAAAERPVD
jgi:hypothetical protein